MSAAATIDPEKIRKQLSDLWVDLGKEKDGEAGVLRACSMTLIAAVNEADDPAPIGETIAMLMREHPSRAIVVRVRKPQPGEAAEHFLAERVLAQCWMPFGNRRQICCEQVEITSSEPSLTDLPAVLLPLLVADLPVVLWARERSGLKSLAGIAGKVIVESAGPDDLAELESLAKTHRIADLAWARLTLWREAIAQVFENAGCQAELQGLTCVRVVYTGDRPTASDIYLAAWLGRPRIVWERGDFSAVSLEKADGERHTRLRATGGDGVEVNVLGQISHAVFPAPTDYSSLREELSIAGRDAVFEAALPRAVKIARDLQ